MTVPVLVVDDCPRTLEILQRSLSAAGHPVFAASSVPEGIRVLEQTRIDLVVTDLRMPRISGLDLVRHVHENYRDTEIMMITGFPRLVLKPSISANN